MMQPGKRKHYRLAVEAPCVLKIVRENQLSDTSPAFKGLIKDLSEGGILINTDRLQEKGLAMFPEVSGPGAPKPRPNTLLVKFSLPEEKDPFVAYCELRWYDQADLSDPYEFQVGGRISRIGKHDMDRLQQYLLKHGQVDELEEYQRRYRLEPEKPEDEERLGKRKRSRFFDAVLPVRYRIVSATTGKRSSVCRTTTHQVSLAGLNAEVSAMNVDGIDMVFDDTPMKRNSLELEISLPRQVEAVAPIGEVHWVERFPSKDGYKYFVGIRFLRISQKDLGLLAQYIKGKPEAEDMAQRGR